MKKIKKVLLVLLTILALGALSLFIYLQTTRPVYEGNLEIRNISRETTVYFDTYGIPHIYAASQKDAMTVLGYVHAQDRLWQMELMRRIAPGRLSEIFGVKALKTDRFFAGLGIDDNAAQAVAQLDKNSQGYLLAQAYLDGINQYIDQGKTPVEIRLLGIKPQHFTLKDVYNIFGFMSFSFAMAQKTDPLLTDIRDHLGLDYLKDFGINGELGTQQLPSFEGKYKAYSEISQSVTSLLEKAPVPAFIGSNSWVVGASKTKNGKVILANDPHIMYAEPGTWFEAHISCPGYEMYGYYIAGTPFPLLGHNHHYAYGLTMFENDDVDFFAESTNPANQQQYKTPNGYQRFTYQQKTIKVKDSADAKLTVMASKHGPIMNGLLDGLKASQPIAMSWVYTQQPNQILKAVYELSHAHSLSQFHQSIGLIHAPGLNVMYGDVQGNIAWVTSGKLYRLPDQVNGNFILSGANGKDDVKTWLPFTQNPQAINPPSDYVYSSNNQPAPVNGYLYPGYYLPKDRALRIDGLLKAKNDWTKADVSKMIVDNTSATAQTIVRNMVNQLNTQGFSANEKQALAILNTWKATHELHDVAPTIYNKWLYFYLKATFEDELKADGFNLLLGTHIVKQMIASQSANPNSPWWDNVNTPQKETQSTILTQSFKKAVASLHKQWGSDPAQWKWSAVHQLTFQHPIGKVKVFSPFFNVGPFAVAGSNEVINNQMFIYTDDKVIPVKAGPSTRRIIDFSDVENSWSVLPTGQSGNPMSRHYDDQAQLFISGKFRKMLLNKKEIESVSTRLVFRPKH